MPFHKRDVEKIYDMLRVKRNSGKNASYIPELEKVDPNIYAISICDTKGKTMNFGDYNKKVAIESVSKVFSLILALNKYNVKTILEKIGSSKEIHSFNSLDDVLHIKNHTINSFVNAGAIATTSLLYDKTITDTENKKRIDKSIKQNMEDFCGEKLSINKKVFESEHSNNQHNRKLVTNLTKYKRFYGDAETILDCYTKQCSYMVSSKNIAVMAATLANDGINPITKKDLTSPENVNYTVNHMARHGMYDESPDWWKATHMPAKSGVGGIIMIVIPGIMGIGIVSPPLNKFGNSARGVETGKMVSAIKL
jgi:glutaminase